MRIFKSVQDLRPQNGACVTIGNFDGVHLGHQSLINLSRQLAQANRLDFILITFWPHPRLVLPGSGVHSPLSSHQGRLALLAEYGAENILELPFTPSLAGLSAAGFVENYLLPLNLRHLVVGHDFTLGRGREGDVAFLRQLASKCNFNIDQAPPFMVASQPVSSTRLRQCLLNGAVAEAERLLGRPYKVCGKVVHGEGRGSGLGFPTANLGEYEVMLPVNGVYATYALCDGARYKAVTNIGANPTFNGKAITVESFLLDCDINLYGNGLCLEFMERLRGERAFSGPGALVSQIDRDVQAARSILARAGA